MGGSFRFKILYGLGRNEERAPSLVEIGALSVKHGR